MPAVAFTPEFIPTPAPSQLSGVCRVRVGVSLSSPSSSSSPSPTRRMEVLGLMLGESLHSSSSPASPDGKWRAQLCLSDPSRGLARPKRQACDFVRGKRARLGRHDHISDLPLAIGLRSKSQMRRRRGTWTLTGRLIGISTDHGQDCINHSHLPISRFLRCLDE